MCEHFYEVDLSQHVTLHSEYVSSSAFNLKITPRKLFESLRKISGLIQSA